MGFTVWGVDRVFKKTYPYRMTVADAIEVLHDTRFLSLFDVIHASPPCQENTRAKHLRTAQGKELKDHGQDLITPVREALRAWGGVYVIENVPGAPLVEYVTVCGQTDLNLGVRRHRWFESNVPIQGTVCRHNDFPRPIGVYGSPNDDIPDGGRTARTLAEAHQAMGITWMGWNDLKESIPPAYTEHIGKYLLEALR